MINYRDLFKDLGWRALIAGLVLGCGAYVISKGLGAGGGTSSIGYFLFGMAIFVVAAIIMGMPLAAIVGEFVTNIFYPSHHYKGPQPVYGIPEANRKKGRIQDSFDGFQKIAEQHPQELRAYIEMIDIAIMDLKNPDLASSVHQSGLENLQEEDARETLSNRYKEICSRK
jgi:hypothetical protein